MDETGTYSNLENEKREIPAYYEWVKTQIGVEPYRIAELYPYNVGTAIVYLLRAGKKVRGNQSGTEAYVEDLEKAISHLRFEIERAWRERKDID